MSRSEFEEPFDPPAVARAYGRLLRSGCVWVFIGQPLDISLCNASAHSSDLSDVESLGLVKVGLSDKLGRPIAIIVGAALPECGPDRMTVWLGRLQSSWVPPCLNTDSPPYFTFRQMSCAEELRELCGLLLVRTLDALAEGPYALVYVHTRCHLPVTIIELRLLLWLCSPLFGHHFWPSVCYADDLIELESYFPSAGNNGDLRTVQQYLPGFVRAYDAQRDSPLAARARELRAVDEAEAAAAVGINH
ncbi:hypothetical protein T492DRAFT_847290 [Pavlovales sp. CCMP2436]|nr:hypothetical protein T492DRAFT_847290 [Pavlovales sp. CCMP2436]